jgi:hypothetical protein
LIEDPGYAVGLGEYGAVTEAEAESKADPQAGAVPLGRSAQYDEAHEVAREDADEEDVAEFAARGHYNRGAVKPTLRSKDISPLSQALISFLPSFLSFHSFLPLIALALRSLTRPYKLAGLYDYLTWTDLTFSH